MILYIKKEALYIGTWGKEWKIAVLDKVEKLQPVYKLIIHKWWYKPSDKKTMIE
jgi:hypothetical protein